MASWGNNLTHGQRGNQRVNTKVYLFVNYILYVNIKYILCTYKLKFHLCSLWSPNVSGMWAKLFPKQITASKPSPNKWRMSLGKVNQFASSITRKHHKFNQQYQETNILLIPISISNYIPSLFIKMCMHILPLSLFFKMLFHFYHTDRYLISTNSDHFPEILFLSWIIRDEI